MKFVLAVLLSCPLAWADPPPAAKPMGITVAPTPVAATWHKPPCAPDEFTVSDTEVKGPPRPILCMPAAAPVQSTVERERVLLKEIERLEKLLDLLNHRLCGQSVCPPANTKARTP